MNPQSKPGAGLIFLASPYRDPSPALRQWRYQAVVEFCAKYLLSDVTRRPLYSPIVHSHPIALVAPGLLERDTAFWMHANGAMLHAATELWVLGLPGWEKSEGIAAERAHAEYLGKPVYVYRPVAVAAGAFASWERVG
ncbi:MAG: DUF1937 family protein [Gammaproteobacteria bacterium]